MRKNEAEDRLNRFFSSLELELVRYAGNVSSPATDFAIDRLFTRCRKKAKYERPALRSEAIEKFLDINKSLDPDSFHVSLPSSILNNARLFIAIALEKYTKRLIPESLQECLDYGLLLDQWRFGPGASNGIRGTHVADKIDQVWTVTSSAIPFVKILKMRDPYFRVFESLGLGSLSEVQGSRFETVPKNESTVRSIAIEPLGNMALQLAAGEYISGALKLIGLNIETQQAKNNALACRGSIDGSLSTIDLSSASDRISVELVRLLMPERWFQLLMAIRSPSTEIDGVQVKMNMISTMGNGFTFALMTLLLTSLIYAYRCEHGGPRLFIDWKTAAVYGDDIIVKTGEFPGFCRLLEACGLVVNVEKSYHDGPFRESCGGDYWNGVNVSPFYVKSLSCDADIYSAMNSVLDWSTRHDIGLSTPLSMLKWMLGGKCYLVPEWFAPTSGVRTQDCGRRFSYLAYVPVEQAYHGVYSMKLFVGGYLLPKGSSLVYVPRPRKVRYVVRKSRLPQGYSDGWDALKADRLASNRRAFWVASIGT